MYEDEPDAVDLTIGTFDSFTAIPKADKPLAHKLQIGFIREKKDYVTTNPRRSSKGRARVLSKGRGK